MKVRDLGISLEEVDLNTMLKQRDALEAGMDRERRELHDVILNLACIKAEDLGIDDEELRELEIRDLQWFSDRTDQIRTLQEQRNLSERGKTVLRRILNHN